jgi:hypothetical protein
VSQPEPAPSAFLSRSVFLRLLALSYFAAFTSLWSQAQGLMGTQGILPLEPFLQAVREQTGGERYFLLPTLFWIDGSDTALSLACGAGTALSLLLFFGVAPVPALAGLWMLYLSLVSAGRVFLSFQWDTLLLEAGFLSIFLAPLQIRPGLSREASPPRLVLWLARWLLFRLMFLSGAVKLASGDPTWRGLTALSYHYETQPLPTWIGWWAHQLPAAFQSLSVVGMFAVELGAPFLIFAPRKFRQLAVIPLIGLQILIALTGNYAFFNLLTIALVLLLLDDSAWPARFRAKLPERASGKRWPLAITAPLASLIVLISGAQVLGTVGLSLPWPEPVRAVFSWAAPFRSVNPYGLFAVMTTSRPEILIEGSNDGQEWHAYRFRWKPDDPRKRPRFVAPHQPRLDWQLWFAALGSYRENPWFIELLRRLLEGSPPVLALFAENPFPSHPPRYVRASLYDYRFTDRQMRAVTGDWWRRTPRGLYSPVMALKEARANPLE